MYNSRKNDLDTRGRDKRKQLFKSFSARWKLSDKNMCSEARKEGIYRTTSRKRQMTEPIELSPSNDSNSTDFEINGNLVQKYNHDFILLNF